MTSLPSVLEAQPEEVYRLKVTRFIENRPKEKGLEAAENSQNSCKRVSTDTLHKKWF